VLIFTYLQRRLNSNPNTQHSVSPQNRFIGTHYMTPPAAAKNTTVNRLCLRCRKGSLAEGSQRRRRSLSRALVNNSNRPQCRSWMTMASQSSSPSLQGQLNRFSRFRLCVMIIIMCIPLLTRVAVTSATRSSQNYTRVHMICWVRPLERALSHLVLRRTCPCLCLCKDRLQSLYYYN
jgi:hypothetical protein